MSNYLKTKSSSLFDFYISETTVVNHPEHRFSIALKPKQLFLKVYRKWNTVHNCCNLTISILSLIFRAFHELLGALLTFRQMGHSSWQLTNLDCRLGCAIKRQELERGVAFSWGKMRDEQRRYESRNLRRRGENVEKPDVDVYGHPVCSFARAAAIVCKIHADN